MLAPPRHRLGRLSAVAPALLGALDFGFVALAAPAIAADLQLGSAYPWLFSAGSLAYGAVVMPAEALIGRVPHLLAAALTIAAAGALLLAFAGDVTAAVAGRVLFGAGTGAAAAPALVLLAEEGDAAFARMGGAIALGFSGGVLLGAVGAWRAGLIAVFALTVAAIVAAARDTRARSAPGDGRPPGGGRARSPGGAPGALRIGAATAAAGAFLALVRAEPFVAVLALAAAVLLGASGLRARPARPPAGPLVAGAATTMSGVGAIALLGLRLDGTPSPADDLALALFGLATLAAVGAARRLAPRPAATAGLALQALAILALTVPAALVPAVVLFGAGHVVANAGAAAAALRDESAAGLFASVQYFGAGAGALVALNLGDPAGMTAAAAIALLGVAAVQRRAPTQSASRAA